MRVRDNKEERGKERKGGGLGTSNHAGYELIPSTEQHASFRLVYLKKTKFTGVKYGFQRR
jgi:hypothetical protein